MVDLGFKANLTDLDAAILRPQLPRALAQRAAREAVDLRYRALLPELAPSLFRQAESAVPPLPERVGQSTHHLFTVHVAPERRDAALTALGARGIGVAVNYRAIHTLSYLVKVLGIPRGALPHAEAIGDRTISLPQYPSLTEEQQVRVARALEEALTC
jgi:UDP-4-amino-4-deoxy-L-arabinose-oxoglutarate aminotransferase